MKSKNANEAPLADRIVSRLHGSYDLKSCNRYEYILKDESFASRLLMMPTCQSSI